MSDMPQILIDRLNAQLNNDRRARERGDAKVIASYKPAIAETLKALEALGYSADECFTACGY